MKKNLLLTCVLLGLATIGTAYGQSHAYLWDPSTGIRDLGTLGGDSFAYGLNDQGTVVGVYAPNDGRVYYHGFIWTEATGMVDIGVPGGGDSDTAEVFCFAVNNSGNVVGRARQVDGRQVAFFWSPTDGFTVLGDISSRTDNGNSANAINEHDVVTGNLIVNSRGPIYHAFRWSPGMIHPRDLGVVDGAQFSLGNGINNFGKIVGGAYPIEGYFEPISWTQKAGMMLVGIVPGSIYAQVNAINDIGEIVGLDQTGASDLAFYSAHGIGLKFLQGLGGNATSALAINQGGEIVGYATDITGTTHAVRWLSATSAPEVFSPSAVLALGINNLGQIVGEGYFPEQGSGRPPTSNR